jgi:catechol 2,3-dioxygenase-like lactoylglutathione lyase family enzyme
MTDADALRATGALHCNLNVRTLAGAVGVYEGLQLRVRMRSRAEGQDATGLGIARPTDSEAWFLYDHRGGRSAPAVELVEWIQPKTEGASYAHPSEVGMQALGFDVADAGTAAEEMVKAGAQVRPGGPQGVDTVVLDADGVAVELTTAGAPAPTLRYARIVCADLAASANWYGRLGFAAVGPERSLAWEGGTDRVAVREQRVALAGPPSLELRLTQWPDNTPRGRAHAQANHRGLFRMALAVTDVRAASDAARRVGGIDASDPSWIPLPGTPLGGLWVSFFRDPNGVMVEYVERPAAS